jgi:hypothetical protein
LTPRQFQALGIAHRKREERAEQRVRFLATAISRAFGCDVNYMDDTESDVAPSQTEEEARARADMFAAWLRARAEVGNNGEGTANISDPVREFDGATDTDGAVRDGDRAI